MAEQIRQLLAVFRQEAVELSDEIAEITGPLKEVGGQERTARLRALMAVAHTLKGAAFSVGAKSIGELAHTLEDLFGEALNREQSDADWYERLATLVGRLQTETALLGAEADCAPEAPQNGVRTQSSEVRRRLKVEVARLDALAASASGLLTGRGSMLHEQDVLEACHTELAAHAAAVDDPKLSALVGALGKRVRTGRQLLREQERAVSVFSASLRALRMQPLADQAPYLKQIIRDACERLGRSAELVYAFGDIEMDKQLLDELREPLMHLLRNAVGHGIASPEEREALGKPRTGRIAMQAAVQGEFIEVRIDDDGVGFDLQRIAERATRHGLRADRGVEDQDVASLLELLFHDGFTTSLGVDEVSGRGVGLNVVRRTVERLGGTVEASPSEALGGASFVLRLPTTILSTAGILVGVGEELYMLPTAQVNRVIPFDPKRVHRAGDVMVHEVDGDDPIEIEGLGQLIGRGGRIPAHGLVVVLENGRRVLGVVVDRLVDQREFTAKPLPSNLIGRVPGVSRATVLADGSVAPCIDIGVLLGKRRPAPRAIQEGAAATKRVLVVDDSMSTRTLQQSVLAAAGYQVAAAVDGVDAWEKLQQHRFDLVVTDIQMPRLDGFGLLAKIRADRKMRDMPVILATSLASQDDIARGADAGATEYVIKGQYDHQGLRDIVSKYL